MFDNLQGSILYNGNEIGHIQLVNIKSAILSMLEGRVTKDSVIGIALPRTPDLLATILAAIDLNVPFVPFDVKMPSARRKQMVRDAYIDIIITTHSIDVDWDVKHQVFIDDVNISLAERAIKTEMGSDVMYILFTSGSTGMPKGVEVTRKGFINFVEGVAEIIDFTPGKRIACLTTVSFDIFFLESIMALYKGLVVVLGNEEEQKNPKLMARLIQANNVDMIQMTPSKMQLLLNFDSELSCLENVKEIMIGGEPFPPGLLRILRQKTTAKIYNMYGPTETTIWSMVSDLSHKNQIDLGFPIKDTEIYIVNENLYILPVGQIGEICIAGKGLAKGYVGRKDLTSEKFVNLPQKSGIRVYRTGDMGRYLPDGNLEYLGRTDNQVKIRGHRIELEEIEANLNQLDGVIQSVVVATEMDGTDKVLRAFYTSSVCIETKDIREYLCSKLPEYMLPADFIRVKNFIQTDNGKIDRKRVWECEQIKYDLVGEPHILYDELTNTQRKVLDIIIFNLEDKLEGDIPLDVDLITMGFDSINFVNLAVILEDEFEFEFEDNMLLVTSFSSIYSLLEYVERKIISTE